MRHRDATTLTEAAPLVDEGHDCPPASRLRQALLPRSRSAPVHTVRPSVAATTILRRDARLFRAWMRSANFACSIVASRIHSDTHGYRAGKNIRLTFPKEPAPPALFFRLKR